MKKLILLAISCLMLNTLSAQIKTVKFEVGPSLVFPSGYFRSFASSGIGVEGTFIYQLSKRYALFGSTGFDSFGARSDGDITFKSTVHVPIMFGIRRYCKRVFGGIGFGTGTYDFGHSGYATTHFSFAPQIGVGGEKFEVSLKYNYTSMFGVYPAYFNFTAAYKF